LEDKARTLKTSVDTIPRGEGEGNPVKGEKARSSRKKRRKSVPTTVVGKFRREVNVYDAGLGRTKYKE